MNARPVIQAGQRSSREEEIEIRLDRQPGDEPDPDHDYEIDPEDHVVDEARMKSQHAGAPCMVRFLPHYVLNDS